MPQCCARPWCVWDIDWRPAPNDRSESELRLGSLGSPQPNPYWLPARTDLLPLPRWGQIEQALPIARVGPARGSRVRQPIQRSGKDWQSEPAFASLFPQGEGRKQPTAAGNEDSRCTSAAPGSRSSPVRAKPIETRGGMDASLAQTHSEACGGRPLGLPFRPNCGITFHRK